MGLFDQITGAGGQPQQRPGFGSTVAAGVVLALLVKAVRGYQASHGGAGAGQPRSFDPDAPAQQPAGGGLGGILGDLGGLGSLGGLGGLASGGGLGGLLGGLGGAGALGALINRFHESGHGQQVSSWVGDGPNQSIQPDQVADALGDNAIDELQQKTGMPRESLLKELAHQLPEAISQATPGGRPPDDQELHQIAAQPRAT